MTRRFFLSVFFLVVAVITLVNQLHLYYPDEQENILGGVFINHFRLPYSGFFTHHNPGAYFAASFITAVTGPSFVRFRLMLGFFYLVFYVVLTVFMVKKFSKAWLGSLLILVLTLALIGTYDWTHMLLADSLGGLLLLVSYVYLFLSVLTRHPLTRHSVIGLCVVNFLTLLTTLSLAYAAGLVYLFAFIYYLHANPHKLKSLGTFVLAASLPWLIFLLYLVTTNSWHNYYQFSIRYNADYYISDFDGASIKNPLRVAVVLGYRFLGQYRTTLAMVKDLNFGSPFPQTLVLANTALLIYLVLNRRFQLFSLVLSLFIFINTRSNVYTTTETDYQAAAYHFFSLFNASVVLYLLYHSLEGKLVFPKRLIYSTQFLVTGVFFFFFSYQLLEKWSEKAYLKYMGRAPLVYDRPVLATFLNTFLTPQDKYFIGPFDFEDQMYLHSQPASVYIVVLPGFDHSPQIQSQLLSDLDHTQPKLIVYNTEERLYGSQPGAFLKTYLGTNYINLEDLGVDCTHLTPLKKWFGEFDFQRHFFFPKAEASKAVDRLASQGWLVLPSGQSYDPGCLQSQ